MGERRKHADFIHAWAEGAEVEILDNGRWVDAKTPNFAVMHEYRIKPKTVKHEGWVNVYGALSGYPMAQVFDTEKEAMNAEDPLKLRKATVRIEWEEEV